MNVTELAIHVERRIAQAERICKEPEKFKVCDQCNSIAFKQASICPICHAYTWLESKAMVQGIAMFSANFAFPLTAGYVPRLLPI